MRASEQIIIFGGGPPAVPAFSPSSLFGGSDTGDWWDVSNSARIWTDTAGTTAAGDGASVARIDGLKNGNNLTQGTSSRRPVRHLSNGQWYLTLDGADDYLFGSFTLNQPATRISAVQQVAWVSNARIYDGGVFNAGALFQFSASPTVALFAGSQIQSSSLAVATTAIVTEIINGSSSKLAVNNGSYVTGAIGASNPAGLTIAASGAQSGTNIASVLFFGGIEIGRILTDAEIAKCRTYIGGLAGLSL